MIKIVRITALFLCVLFLSSLTLQANAVNETPDPVLVQYATELSACTSLTYYKYENTQRYIDYKQLHTDYAWEKIITYVNIGLDRYFYSMYTEIANPKNVNVLVNKYNILPAGFVPSQLEYISSIYRVGAQKLTHEARIAFEKMCAAGKKAGYPVFTASAYRSYARQAQIYASFAVPGSSTSISVQDSIAARPGFSEHQMGLAVDISRANTLHTNAETYKWYAQNAYKFGFILRYPSGKEGVTGYTGEPWHLRYLGVTLATAVYRSGYTYEEYYAKHISLPLKSAVAPSVGITVQSDVIVDGTAYQLSAYNVLGETYHKLRDIAVILNGTNASFDVTWDGIAKRITLLAGVPYSSDPTLGSFTAARAMLVTAACPGLSCDGIAYTITSFYANGTNYYKLADILGILGLTATDDGTGRLMIDTSLMTVPTIQPSDVTASPAAAASSPAA